MKNLIALAERHQNIDLDLLVSSLRRSNYKVSDVTTRFSISDFQKELARGRVPDFHGIKDRTIRVFSQNGQQLLFLSTETMFERIIQEKIRNFLLSQKPE
jgi:hypothetical protein